MAEYEYQAETAEGVPQSGRLIAIDESAARRQLTARGLIVRDILWCPVADEAGELGDEQVTSLVQVVGSGAASRLPLEVSLSVLAEDTDDPRLAAVARRLARQVEQGMPLTDAVDALGNELPEEVRGLVHAGIESGDLAGVFERFAEQRLASQRIGRRIRQAIAYPIIVTVILVPILLLMSLYVIPMFGELYGEMNLDLPAMTQVILQTSGQIPGLIAGFLFVIVALPIVLRLTGGRWLFHRFRCALPLFGRLWTWSGQREFASLLASFLDQRLTLPRALDCTGQVMTDRNVARACSSVAQRLQAGEALSSSLSHSISFDRTLTSMIAWGETYNLLPDALRIASQVFDDRVEQHLALVRRLVPPVTLIFVGTMAIFVMVALFVPMVRLIEGLSM
jgi:type II secretory pathway component PulF